MSKWLRFAAIFFAALQLAVFAASANELKLEVVAELQQAPGNITLTPDGRMIISLHQFYGPELRVAEVARTDH